MLHYEQHTLASFALNQAVNGGFGETASRGQQLNQTRGRTLQQLLQGLQRRRHNIVIFVVQIVQQQLKNLPCKKHMHGTFEAQMQLTTDIETKLCLTPI